MYYNNIRLQSIYRNRLFYKRYIKLSIPIPKPLPHGKGLCMLCWLCIVQSLWAYTPGVRAGAECGAAALTPLGATPQTPFCATAAHKNSPDLSSGEFLLIDRGDVYKLSLYLAGAVSHLR